MQWVRLDLPATPLRFVACLWCQVVVAGGSCMSQRSVIFQSLTKRESNERMLKKRKCTRIIEGFLQQRSSAIHLI